jgi:hypothetical protein
MSSQVYIAPDEEIIQLFCNAAPIVKENAQFAKAMNSEAGRYDLAQALMYFALGYRACEHVQNRHEWLDMLSDAADPEHPQMALPGVDFGVENILEALAKKRSK